MTPTPWTWCAPRPVAAGNVIYAGWSTGGWSPYGQIVVLEHDFGDGKVYQSLYAHLQSVSVKLGQKVAVGAEVGTLGGSANGKLNALAYHLHFALYRGAKLEGGPYGGVAVVPEPLSVAPPPSMMIGASGRPWRLMESVSR